MQTFLPYNNIEKSVKALDDKRLGKQRVEALQIYQALTKGSRWINHPAVQMWRGYEYILARYHNECIQEWIDRGKNNTMEFLSTKPLDNPDKWLRRGFVPWWFGDKRFHLSHQSNLLRKSTDYAKVFDIDSYEWVYLWPYPDKKVYRITFPDWVKEGGYMEVPKEKFEGEIEFPDFTKKLVGKHGITIRWITPYEYSKFSI